MSPTRYSSLFRNRWLTIMWAAGVCWSAVEFTSCMDLGPPDGVAAQTTAATDDAASLNELQALVGQLEK
ncbi:hypothetical protein [Sphingomonas montana]|uniref:hypothetical protein n=1 Tax=Sphingomonas montana TaxID=1843236 RepID=UPI00096ECA20|nr:hypothetical protein [Sphingomonas montana]